jgi:hypothetical protein
MAAVLILDWRVTYGLARQFLQDEKKRRAALIGTDRPSHVTALQRYFDEPLPVLLPLEPVLPPAPLLEPEPMPLPLGAVVVPLAPPEAAPPVAPPVAPLELAPDLLKYASHSLRDTWPSLFVSTELKLGAEAEAPPEASAPLDMPELPPLEAPPDAPDELLPDAPDELLPVALGEDEDLSLLLDEELCAIDTLASANSAAAVAVVINFNFIWSFLLQESRG